MDHYTGTATFLSQNGIKFIKLQHKLHHSHHGQGIRLQQAAHKATPVQGGDGFAKTDQFCEYKNQLSGLTAENIDEVCNHIAALGLYMGPVSDAAAASAG